MPSAKHALAVFALAFAAGCSSPADPTSANVQGRWVGSWARQSCTDQGSGSPGFCSAVSAVNPLTLVLTQSGAVAQGTVDFSGVPMTVSGPVSGTGVSLTGQTVAATGTTTLSAWSSTVSGTSMTGTFSVSILLTGGTGPIAITATLQNVTRQ